MMNSTELIQKAKDSFKELKHKSYEWKSFYNGFLIGFSTKVIEDTKENRIMKTQYGDLLRTDVSENSMTFKIEGDITTNLGRYAIVPVEDNGKEDCYTCKYCYTKGKCNHPQGCEGEYELWEQADSADINQIEVKKSCQTCYVQVTNFGTAFIPCPLCSNFSLWKAI